MATKRGRVHAYPELLKLAPGKSVDFPVEQAQTVRMAVAYIKRKTGIAFITRTADDKIKVWRK